MTLLRRLLCLIVGHQFFVVQEFGTSRRVGCHCCDGDWGMHDDTRSFVPWGPDLEEMYRVTGRRVLKR